MKNYAIYDANGMIVQSGSCIDSDLQNQQYDKTKYNLIECDAIYNIHYIENNIAIKIPPKPNNYFVFDYSIKKWIPNNVSAINEILNVRQQNLVACDWTQIPNGPLTEQQQQAWAVYRQELRDITTQSGYPFNVIWPTPPQG